MQGLHKTVSKGASSGTDSKYMRNESCHIIFAVVLQMQYAEQPATTWAQLLAIPGEQNLPFALAEGKNQEFQTIYFLRINIFSFEINTNQFERWGNLWEEGERGQAPVFLVPNDSGATRKRSYK